MFMGLLSEIKMVLILKTECHPASDVVVKKKFKCEMDEERYDIFFGPICTVTVL